MSWLSKAKEKWHETVTPVVQKVAPTYVKAAGAVAIGAGTLFGGAAGTGLGTAAADALALAFTPGGRDAKKAQAAQFTKWGIGLAGASAGLGLASGAGIGASPIASFGAIFGSSGAASAPAVANPSNRNPFDLSGSYPTAAPLENKTGGSGFLSGMFGSLFGNNASARQTGGVAGLGGLGATGGIGADAAPGFTPNLSPDQQQAQGSSKLLILAAGAAAVLLFALKKR